MKITLVTHEIHTRHPFRIARPRLEEVRNVFICVEEDGVAGWGEASPNAFYGETEEVVARKLGATTEWARSLRLRSVADLERAWAEAWRFVAPSKAAQCALDLAFWDWLAQREGVGVSELAWGEPARPVETFGTIGLSTTEELPAKVEEMRPFSMIKIKSDARVDLEPVRLVRKKNAARIAVDANCAWGEANLSAVAAELALLGVEFIEQPFPPADDRRLVRHGYGLPIIADESCVLPQDVEAIGHHFDGFNIKLVKCGGLTPALRMARRGRELGLRTMVGCMLESSVLIAAGAVVAQKTDYADLDGAWLLQDDPFNGWEFERGMMRPPAASGLGVRPLRSWAKAR